MKSIAGSTQRVILALALATLPFVAMAQPASHGAHGAGSAGSDQVYDAATGSWRTTLTDDQKAEISLAHLRMRQLKDVFDARIEVVRAGIRNIVTDEEGGEGALETAVEDLMELERERVTNHFRYLMEVRQLLTPQQRVSFDLDVIEGRIDPVRSPHGAPHQRRHERGGHR